MVKENVQPISTFRICPAIFIAPVWVCNHISANVKCNDFYFVDRLFKKIYGGLGWKGLN
jgi:hypothetical protein